MLLERSVGYDQSNFHFWYKSVSPQSVNLRVRTLHNYNVLTFMKYAACEDALVEFICKDYQTICVVESTSFLKYPSTLVPKYTHALKPHNAQKLKHSYSLLIAYVYCRDDSSRIHMGVAHSYCYELLMSDHLYRPFSQQQYICSCSWAHSSSSLVATSQALLLLSGTVIYQKFSPQSISVSL